MELPGWKVRGSGAKRVEGGDMKYYDCCGRLNFC